MAFYFNIRIWFPIVTWNSSVHITAMSALNLKVLVFPLRQNIIVRVNDAIRCYERIRDGDIRYVVYDLFFASI